MKKPVRLPRSIKRIFPQVNSVKDSKNPIEVTVGKKDCDEGRKLAPNDCAFARAAKRELKADGVIIGISSSYVIKGKEAIRFATPEAVRREIVSFDRHQDFAPGDYRLVPKAPSAHFGQEKVPQRRNKGYSRTETASKRKTHHSARVRVLPRGVE